MHQSHTFFQDFLAFLKGVILCYALQHLSERVPEATEHEGSKIGVVANRPKGHFAGQDVQITLPSLFFTETKEIRHI
jgi:hypothetical protein